VSGIFLLANVHGQTSGSALPGAKWVSKVKRPTLAAQHIRFSGARKIYANTHKTAVFGCSIQCDVKLSNIPPTLHKNQTEFYQLSGKRNYMCHRTNNSLRSEAFLKIVFFFPEIVLK